jgi:VanZ family protein
MVFFRADKLHFDSELWIMRSFRMCRTLLKGGFRMKKPERKWLILFGLWFFLIAWLSLQSGLPSIEIEVLSWDKFQHAMAFGVLTWLGGMAFQHRFRNRVRGWTWVLLLSLLYGGSIEIAQRTLTSSRAAEWGDLLADATGAGLIYIVALVWLRRQMREGRRIGARQES